MDRFYIKQKAFERKEVMGDIAKKLGISGPTLSTIVSGANVSPDLAKKIAAWHGEVTAAEVLWGKSDAAN